MEQVLVKLYVPALEKKYDVWIPSHKRIYNVIYLLVKAINEMNDNNYKARETPQLYDKMTANAYDLNLSVKESNIRNGTELVLI